MGAISDLKEYSAYFSNAPFTLKIYLAISTFFTLGSISHLTDEVIRFRGLLKVGIVFYSEWVMQPVQNIFKSLGYVYNDISTNYLILFTIVISSVLRMFMLENTLKVMFGSILVLAPWCIWLVIHLANNVPSNSEFVILLVIFIIYPFLFNKKNMELVNYFLPMLFSTFFLLALSALNKGLLASV